MVPLFVKIYSFIYHGLCLIFCLCIIYHSLPGSSLFSWHPVTTAIGVTVLMTQGVVLFDPVFSIFGANEKKQTNVNRHLIIQISAGIMMVIGFVIVFLNKYLKSKNHFISWHSYFGLATVIVFALVTGGGFAANYGVRVGTILRPYHIKWIHSVGGILTFTMAMATCGLGLFSNWAIRNVVVPQRIFLGIVLIIITLIAWERARNRFLFKIFQIPSGRNTTTTATPSTPATS
ncbi:hypothetical protein CHUAL_003533 [Chamberlinius hualienensis]